MGFVWMRFCLAVDGFGRVEILCLFGTDISCLLQKSEFVEMLESFKVFTI